MSLKAHLLLNHFIILYNIFGEATTPMLFYKIEEELWSVMKTFVVFLDKLPEYPKCFIHDVEIDEYCLSELGIYPNGKEKLDKIILYLREEMMTANAPGASGGFGADSPAKGPRAGFSPVMGNVRKRKRPETIGRWSRSLRGKKSGK